MSKPNETAAGTCWETPAKPSAELLGALKAGSFTAEQVRALRRDDVARPVIFVGTGTCGLGAGAAKTLEAVKDYLKNNKVQADVVEVGCVGLCSEEPIVDVQLPGRNRLSLSGMQADKVAGALDSVLAGKVPGSNVLGQFRGEELKSWEKVPYLDQHPFFVCRSVGCSRTQAGGPEQRRRIYRARRLLGDARVLHTMTPVEVCDAAIKSGLRGRGGGGFPAGKKWQMANSTRASRSISSATPTKATRAHLWTARSASLTRSGCLRAWSLRPMLSAQLRPTSTSGPSTPWRCAT